MCQRASKGYFSPIGIEAQGRGAQSLGTDQITLPLRHDTAQDHPACGDDVSPPVRCPGISSTLHVSIHLFSRATIICELLGDFRDPDIPFHIGQGFRRL
jgi:hypothetical protein